MGERRVAGVAVAVPVGDLDVRMEGRRWRVRLGAWLGTVRVTPRFRAPLERELVA